MSGLLVKTVSVLRLAAVVAAPVAAVTGLGVTVELPSEVFVVAGMLETLDEVLLELESAVGGLPSISVVAVVGSKVGLVTLGGNGISFS